MTTLPHRSMSGMEGSASDRSGWSWLLGRGQLPTTAAGAQRLVVLLVIGLRVGTVVQMAPSAVRAWEVSPNAGAAAASWLVAVGAALTVTVVVVRRGDALGPVGTSADVGIAVTLLLLGPLTVPVEDRIGTWVGFQPGYALSVLIACCAVRNKPVWAVGVAAIIVSLVWFDAAALDDGSTVTVFGNVLTYLILAVIARVTLAYLRRLAQDADTSRVRAAELARREEERRAQIVLHNGVTVMSLLADPTIEPAVRTQLEEQARQEAHRLRTYLRGTPRTAGERSDLAGLVIQVAALFPELPIELALDLGGDVELSSTQAEPVRQALVSILLNVRLHAAAHQVVVHLDRDERRWTLSVHDDGRGFDVDTTPTGVGTRELVVGELGRCGIKTSIRSQPGEGTTVTLRSAIADRTPITP